VERFVHGLPPGPERNAFYDGQTVQVMWRVLRRDSNCVDVGAHTGAILRHMVAIAPDGVHDAFEPIPELAAELQRQFRTVRVHQMAVANTDGVSEFQYVVNDPGYSGLRRRMYDRVDPVIQPIHVQVRRIDDVIASEHRVDFVKLDIEGGEYDALVGGARTIRRWKPVIVFEAAAISTGQYGVRPADFYELVTCELGYQLSTMTRWFRGWPPLSPEGFVHNWSNGPNFYFIATPFAG
jgi:FkbM family methyltransferase